MSASHHQKNRSSQCPNAAQSQSLLDQNVGHHHVIKIRDDRESAAEVNGDSVVWWIVKGCMPVTLI